MTFPSKSSLNSYGDGVLVDQFAVVNPQSELTAANLNNLRNDCAAMTTTAPILHFQFDGYSGTTNPVVVSSSTWATGWDSAWGNNNIYVPTITWVSTGELHVQLPAQVPDQIGGTNLVNIRYARATICSKDTAGVLSCYVMSSSTFGITLFGLNNALYDFPGSLIVVEVF
jgi:hypothetical protein